MNMLNEVSRTETATSIKIFLFLFNALLPPSYLSVADSLHVEARRRDGEKVKRGEILLPLPLLAEWIEESRKKSA